MSSPTSPYALPAPKVPKFFFELTPPSLSATVYSPLFKLPLEVRHNIYDKLWAGAKLVKQRDQGCTFTLIYPGSEADIAVWLRPTWATTSKLVLAETIRQFYSKARCTSWSSQDCDPECLVSIYRLISLCHIRYFEESHAIPIETIVQRKTDGKFCTSRDQKYRNGIWSGLTVTRCAEAKHIARFVPVDTWGDASTWVAVVPDFSGESINWTCLEEPFSNIASLVEYFQRRPNEIKSFALTFSLPTGACFCLREEPHDEDATSIPDRRTLVDLTYLESLGTGLNHVIFGLQISYWRGREWAFETFTRLQEELERVAKYLVGAASGQSWSLTDWVTDLGQEETERVEKKRKKYKGEEEDKGTWYYGTWHLEVRRIAGTRSKGTVRYKAFIPPPAPALRWESDDDDQPQG
ncbi:hypothetical protein P154DRAFT_64317 [Amniculicola lignicola CBS 123094]|uniref:Uncharacterized protein n=1 Tax=Amniculicola lignicola CBS 123094 TaxID=1392246 RepID=A0A6A5WT87_9PLEO|nr:hypothetical protein P154DRAFT_64317 [Amniculicola lignicola CBS 123094]